jgi:hypothetical protein
MRLLPRSVRPRPQGPTQLRPGSRVRNDAAPHRLFRRQRWRQRPILRTGLSTCGPPEQEPFGSVRLQVDNGAHRAVRVQQGGSGRVAEPQVPSLRAGRGAGSRFSRLTARVRFTSPAPSAWCSRRLGHSPELPTRANSVAPSRPESGLSLLLGSVPWVPSPSKRIHRPHGHFEQDVRGRQCSTSAPHRVNSGNVR